MFIISISGKQRIISKSPYFIWGLLKALWNLQYLFQIVLRPLEDPKARAEILCDALCCFSSITHDEDHSDILARWENDFPIVLDYCEVELRNLMGLIPSPDSR